MGPLALDLEGHRSRRHGWTRRTSPCHSQDASAAELHVLGKYASPRLVLVYQLSLFSPIYANLDNELHPDTPPDAPLTCKFEVASARSGVLCGSGRCYRIACTESWPDKRLTQ